VQVRSGRALGDGDAAGVNLAHIDIGISDAGMKQRDQTLERLREEFNKIPGAAPSVGGFITHRMDEVLSGGFAPFFYGLARWDAIPYPLPRKPHEPNMSITVGVYC
jgi:hypothetical protein